ncbi:HD-GYP domain-containing protein [Paludibacterium denitrificans]|uniref:HD-GYP domain-containing protein n=1 Tax=Paludibacterium denitrificans TaxID=2675226 RepID=UPI001E55A6A4|nr:HD domain-containing phosphohydrolase [Paludibacterium denitrificans]
MSELKQLAEIFSRIVDAKSPFTAQHSLGVSQLARFLAERMGVSRRIATNWKFVSLLHDLGKLRVPDEILDKPAKLDPNERWVINTHSFETFQILRNIKGFEEIAPWAAYHHEEPGGTGYPFHLHGETLPLEARILRVSDIFQCHGTKPALSSGAVGGGGDRIHECHGSQWQGGCRHRGRAGTTSGRGDAGGPACVSAIGQPGGLIVSLACWHKKTAAITLPFLIVSGAVGGYTATRGQGLFCRLIRELTSHAATRASHAGCIAIHDLLLFRRQLVVKRLEGFQMFLHGFLMSAHQLDLLFHAFRSLGGRVRLSGGIIWPGFMLSV